MSRYQAELSDSQKEHIRVLEGLITQHKLWAERCIRAEMPQAAKAHQTRIKNLENRIEEIRTGVNFGMELS